MRLYDDRLVVYAGTEEIMTLPRGHASPGKRRGRVVNYRHVLPSLGHKPMALLNWVHRDGLFPRDAYRRAFEALREGLDDRQTCRRMVDLLALAHDHCCEARLAPGEVGTRCLPLSRPPPGCEAQEVEDPQGADQA